MASMKTDLVQPTIPPVPEPPTDARALILDVDAEHRIVFALAAMPSESMLFGMRRHVERQMERRYAEFGVSPGVLSWRWSR